MPKPAPKVRVRVLGPVRATRDGTDQVLGGPRQRLVLALLAADVGRTVSTERLIQGVWDDRPPATARKTLQGYVHHLRSAVASAIRTEPAGYRLVLDDDGLDAASFAARADDGRRLLTVDAAAAADLLADALALWAGQAYEDLQDASALQPDIRRLTELRLTALEDRVEADLALPSAPALVGELESLVREYPLRERLHGHLAHALYRAGRQADALGALERHRHHLANDYGLDPSPALDELQTAILRQDPALGPHPAGADPVGTAGASPRGVRGYELHQVIGTGPLGTVHRAYQTSLGRAVALKVLRAEVADDPRVVSHFAAAAARNAALDHPRIVPLLDAWRGPGAAHLVMPLLPGGSVADRVPARGVPAAVATGILADVGEALDHAHRRGVVHGRLVPGNVLLDADDRASISDFPLSGADRIDERHAAWLPPDAVTGRADRATDVHAVASLAHLLLTGRTPRRGSDGMVDVTAVADDLGAGLATTLQAALHPDPTRRPTSVEAVLRRVRRGVGHDVTPAAVLATTSPRSSLRNPYKGLRAFREADAADFHGRNDVVGRVVDALAEHPVVAVVGPSGSGKSSLVHAGVLPALRRQHADGPVLLVADLFPGTHPFEELETALLGVAVDRPPDLAEALAADDRGLIRVAKAVVPNGDTNLLLVVDQFEELFSLVDDEAVRRRFIASLAAAARDDDARIRVLLTLRADFYDRPLEYHELGELLQDGTVVVGAPSPDDLRAAIVEPARAVGLDLEPGLVGALVADVSDEPGALPLLQYALTELVERRTGDELTRAVYDASGGVLGTLGRRAEELWTELTPPAQDALRQSLLRMVTIDEAGDDLRRRVRRRELASLHLDPSELSRALQVFGSHRLLSFDRDPITRGPTVEVAHEALLREWPRLRRWIEDQRDDLVTARRLTAERTEWEAGDRDDSYLLRGEQLARYESWASESSLVLTRPEQDFLAASRQLRDRHRRDQVRRTTRLRRLLVMVSALALVATVAGIAAVRQAGRAGEQATLATARRTEAETRRLALQAPQLVDADRQVALLLAVEAMRRDPGPVSLGALQSVLVGLPGFLGETTLDESYRSITFAGDDELVGLAARSVDVVPAGRATPRLSIPTVEPEAMAVGPSGDVVAIADAGGLRLYELAEGRQVRAVEDQDGGTAASLAFSADGTSLAIGEVEGTARVHDLDDGAVTQVEAHPERRTTGIEVPPHQPDLASFGTRTVALDHDGSRLATGGLVMARVWDVATGDKLDDVRLTRRLGDNSRFPAPVDAVAFADDDGDLLVMASSYNVVRQRVGTGEVDLAGEVEFPTRSDSQALNPEAVAVAVDRDRAVLAQRGGDVTVVWLDGGRPAERFDARTTGVPRVAAADTTIAFLGDRDVSRWSLDGRGLLTDAVPRNGQPTAELSGDGHWLALTSADQRPSTLWRLPALPGAPREPDLPRRVPLPDDPPAHYVVPGPEGRLLSFDLGTQRAHVRRIGSSASPVALRDLDAFESPTFSPDGRRLALATWDDAGNSIIRVLATATGIDVVEPLDELAAPDNPGIPNLDFRTGGSLLIASGGRGEAIVWDTDDWSSRWIARGGGFVMGATPHPDGSRLVTQAMDGRLAVRDADTFQPVGPPLVGQSDALVTLSATPAISPDGRFAVTTSDGSGRLWDLDAGQVVGEPFPTARGTWPDVSHDGRRLVTFDDRHALVWDLDVDGWPDLACTAAGRNLTREEWDQFGPRDTDYRATCPEWPAPDLDPHPQPEHTP